MSTVIDKFSGSFRFLSNFFPASVEYEGLVYPTVEHAYQAQKTLDESERIKIRDLPKPGDTKRYGKTVKLREDWESVKENIMRDLLLLKFSRSDLKTLLLSTGNAVLIEGNNWGDTEWGQCNGIGQNKLGKLLMEVRDYYAS